jgi:hypothetical protein
MQSKMPRTSSTILILCGANLKLSSRAGFS